MKIRLTENQYNRLIIENVDAVTAFERLCYARKEEINKIYSKLIFISLDEILKKEINIEEIINQLDKIESEIYKQNTIVYKAIENHDNEELDERIDDAMSSVTDKINVLSIVLNYLESIQKKVDEHNILRHFRDIKPIQI